MQLSKLNRKGFTLAEMLIVMAVVVVLAAATIPAVGKQIEGARESNDIAALASAYTEAYTAAAVKHAHTAIASDGEEFTVSVKWTQHTKGFGVITAVKVAGVTPTVNADDQTAESTQNVKFKFKPDSTIADGIALDSVTVG